MRVGTTKALHPIIAHLGCDTGRAVEIARQIVLSLTEDDFVESVRMRDGTPADVYGVEMHDSAWYVKVMITPRYPGRDDRLELDVLSCHPPRHDLRTRRGLLRARVE